MDNTAFPAPEPKRQKPRVQPVFIPFQGCTVRCVFCAQTLQTGETIRSCGDTLAALALDLEQAARENAPARELAFYGGTFTALAEQDQFAFLRLAIRYKEKGLISAIRASTRPDAVSPAHLAALRAAGLDMLELGVQSFTDAPLAAAMRGYCGTRAAEGCAAVKESGLRLGIQLMPGMPGMNEEDVSRDVARAAAFAPAAVRLYPCLVLVGTPLAASYRRGEFVPWSLEQIVPLLAEAQLVFWRTGIPVIRIGLAPQDGLDEGGIMAGPAHPALGSIVRGRAFHRYIKEELARRGLSTASGKQLVLPRRYQGEFWGHGRELEGAYAELGIGRDSVAWHEADSCELRVPPRA